MDAITVVVDHEAIKFTPDGKIFVLDAIGSLCSGKNIQSLWQDLLNRKPELAELCEAYPFSKKQSSLVTNSVGWEKIQDALFDHLIDT